MASLAVGQSGAFFRFLDCVYGSNNGTPNVVDRLVSTTVGTVNSTVLFDELGRTTQQDQK